MKTTHTWYEAFCGYIKPVEIDRFNDTSIWIGGHRRNRTGDKGSWTYWPTVDEAKAALIEYETRKRDDAARVLVNCEADLAKTKTYCEGFKL